MVSSSALQYKANDFLEMCAYVSVWMHVEELIMLDVLICILETGWEKNTLRKISGDPKLEGAVNIRKEKNKSKGTWKRWETWEENNRVCPKEVEV